MNTDRLALLCAVSLTAAASTHGARAAVWYDSEAAAGDPLVALSRLGVGYEYTRVSAEAAKEKIIPNAKWALGGQNGRNDWSVAVELPVLVNHPKHAPDESGFGDFKVRVSHLWVDNDSWLAGSYFETELDTAADDVQAIANQRTQLAFGSGFIRNLGRGWAVGGGLQYGWSPDAGATNGHKSEWEYRVGVRKKLLDYLSASVVYKGTIIAIGATDHDATIEPVLTWSFGKDRQCSLSLSCEWTLEGKADDYTAKAGFGWNL